MNDFAETSRVDKNTAKAKRENKIIGAQNHVTDA
jgi:hypothetical protein